MCKYCDKEVGKINKDYPNADWNCDIACETWHKVKENIPDNNIQFKEYSDACYACTCPACGEIICGWCV